MFAELYWFIKQPTGTGGETVVSRAETKMGDKNISSESLKVPAGQSR